MDLREGRAVFLPGNYSETAQARAERRKRAEPPDRKSPPEPRPLAPAPPAPKPPPPAAPTRDASAGKESSRRRRRIQALEEQIASFEAEIEAIETQLWEEALTLGSIAAHALSQRKAARRTELDGLMQEWERLSEEAEQAAHEMP
ncbi:MAG: ABC transporter C-terminal domain-containing protein [Acidobacteriota bacterium]